MLHERDEYARTGSESNADGAREVTDVEDKGIGDRAGVYNCEGALYDIQRCCTACHQPISLCSRDGTHLAEQNTSRKSRRDSGCDCPGSLSRCLADAGREVRIPVLTTVARRVSAVFCIGPHYRLELPEKESSHVSGALMPERDELIGLPTGRTYTLSSAVMHRSRIAHVRSCEVK
jgi:hypothetical protein